MNKFNGFRQNYGILGIIAVLAVIGKLGAFYMLVGISSYFFMVWITSCLLIYLLFASFRINKWIPAVIFAIISVLMFSDITYSSFFNRYLSVDMLGAASVVGDITESIKEVIKPANFLMFVDVIIIFIALYFAPSKKLKKKHDFDALDNNETPEKNVIASRRKRSKKASGKNIVSKHKPPFIALLVVSLLILNVTNSSMVQAVSNQEILTFHIKDIINGTFSTKSNNSLAAFTDDYNVEKEGPLFGVAEGRNLIIIQIESLQNFVVGLKYNGQEITPNINRLIEDNSIYFDNYYQQVGSGNTSDAEFATNNSLYGTLTSYTYKLFNQNYFRGLPVLLKEKGYETAVLHAHEERKFWTREAMYPSEGFDTFYGGLIGREGGCYDMTEWMGWGLTDSKFFEQSMPFINELQQPFYSFLITLSNHHPYIMLDKYNFIDLLPEDEDTIVGHYLQSAAYTDYAIGQFLQALKDDGIYENSIIAMYGDHVGLSHSEEIDTSMERILGKPYDFEEYMSIPLIINIPNSDKDIRQTISTAGGQIDFLPTMAYLMGIDKLDTIYLGHNLLTIKEGFVAEQTHMPKGSFFTNDIAYEMARDGVFENGRAWNINTGESVDIKQCYEGYVRSCDIVNTSEYVLKSDAIAKMYLEGQGTEEVGSINVEREYPEEIVIAGYPDSQLLGKNSGEALEASYNAGFRNIRLEINWDESAEPSEPIATDRITGEVKMRGSDIINWMEANPETQVIMHTTKGGDYLMNYASHINEEVAGRIILELSSTAEYSGRYEAILNVSECGGELNKLQEFIGRNNVWALSMTKDGSTGNLSKLMNAGKVVYIEEDDGRIAKGN